MSEQPFTWTSYRDNSARPIRIRSREAELFCDTVPYPVCLWRRRCSECLHSEHVTRPTTVAESSDYHDPDDENNYEEGREMTEIPLCIYCAIACRDNEVTAVERAFQRIDLANKYPELKAITASAMDQTQLGGDSSMDIPPLSPISALDESSSEAKSMGVIDSVLPGDTIAKLHVRRSRQDPRFAELEGVVPLDSSVQISIDSDHPFHTHTRAQACCTPRHPPSPARRPLPWLRSRNQAGEEKEKTEQQERPASVLDAHFLPCCIKTSGWSHVGEIFTDKPGSNEADIVLGVNFHVHRLTDSVGRDFHVRRIPARDPRGLGLGPEPADIESSDRTVLEEFRLPPPPVERVPATTDEAPRQPSSRLAEEENDDSSTTDTETSILDANANTKAGLNHDTAGPEKKSEGAKGKSVVWDPTVAGGETESDGSDITNSEGESSSHESYEREPDADYYPPRKPPSQGGDPRKRGSLTSPPPTPTQPEEYLESYATAADKKGQRDKNDETRLASLAMPGRWRGRRIGRGRGAVCPRCGHRE
ncbi:hypothetical protein F4680DRAFT_448796 [Xylaria scruposa]|nr:hypothetical protein F4680DRAFT_448796 [Xylaria scruposa]